MLSRTKPTPHNASTRGYARKDENQRNQVFTSARAKGAEGFPSDGQGRGPGGLLLCAGLPEHLDDLRISFGFL